MNDRLFLAWLYNKLVNEGHDPNVNYMGQLRSIIKATPADQLTPNTGQVCRDARDAKRDIQVAVSPALVTTA